MQVENIQDEKFYVDIAIKESSRQLDIAEFIKISNFPIDKFIIDRFWNNIEKKIPIYLDDILIEWCGYQGEISIKKFKFLQTIKNNDIPILDMKNDKYIEYYNQLSDDAKNSCNFKTPQELSEQKWSSSINHILITPLNFKKLVLMLKTSNGDRLRNHFISMDYLLQTYLKYQCEYEKIHYEKEIEKIKKSITNIRYTRLQQINELEKELEQRYKIGVIYFITDGNFVKIGYCYNLKNRLEELQVGSPLKLYVRRHYLSEYPYLEEQRLHEEYKEFHLRGEWFKL